MTGPTVTPSSPSVACILARDRRRKGDPAAAAFIGRGPLRRTSGA